MKSRYLEKIIKIANRIELKLAQQSSQPGDIYKAIYDSKILGLKGDSDNAEFDINSNAANTIFNIFDAAKFKGKISIDVTVDPKQNAAVKVTTVPPSSRVAAAIQQAFQPGIASAVKKVSPPTQTITIPNVITTQNV